MNTFDITPLFRNSIGFDRMMDMFDHANRLDRSAPSYPYPAYDIEKTGEDAYRITLATAGFSEEDLNIETRENALVVSGRHVRESQNGESQYLHRGIASRSFERTFSLADHVQVTGATLENGLLRIDLVREIPEAMKPRQVAINGRAGPRAIEAEAA